MVHEREEFFFALKQHEKCGSAYSSSTRKKSVFAEEHFTLGTRTIRRLKNFHLGSRLSKFIVRAQLDLFERHPRNATTRLKPLLGKSARRCFRDESRIAFPLFSLSTDEFSALAAPTHARMLRVRPENSERVKSVFFPSRCYLKHNEICFA